MFTMFFFPVLILLLAWFVTCIVITSQQHVKIIETFGKFSGIRNAGLSLKMPFPIQTASSAFSLQTRQIHDSVQVKSSDNVFVKIPVYVQFRVIPSQTRQAYYELADPVAQMRSYIVAEIRATASKMSFQELYDDKEQLSSQIQENIGQKMHDYGYLIVDVLVDDPQPTEDIVHAFNDVTASIRAKEAAAGYAEAERVRRVAEARATGEAQEISAKATVSARRILAEGNAEAIRTSIQGTALSAEYGHHLVEMSITAETARDAARQGGRTVIVMGDNSPANAVHGLFAMNGSEGETKKKTGEKATEKKGEPTELDKDGDGVVDMS